MKIKREHLWPIGIVAALAVNVIANVIIIRAAIQPGSEVVESDYYRKAVDWDSTMAQQGRDAALGWKLDATITPEGAGRARLSASILDAAGAPVEGAEVRVIAIHNLSAGRPVSDRLAPRAGGYAADLPLDRSGLWELRFDVRRGAQHFTSTLRRERSPSSGAGAS